MKDKFNKLDAEKQISIINAALIEFAEKGFEKASTNQIVKQAGIGKGMLFYYFNTKQELYHYLLNYSFDILMQKYLNQIDNDKVDFFDHLKHITTLKFNYFTEYPEVNQFLGRFVLIEGMNIPEELKQKHEMVIELGNTKVYGNNKIDSSLFRDDVNPEKAYQLLEWTIKGYQTELLQKCNGKKFTELDLVSLWNEFDEYLAILKTCFYKKNQEYHPKP